MDTKKVGSIKRPMHHGNPANDLAEGEREVVDEALSHQGDINQNMKRQQQMLNRQRTGREMRRSPQMARQGKKAA